MHNSVRIWISIPAIVFDDYTSPKHAKKDINELIHSLLGYGFTGVDQHHFDPRNYSWGAGWEHIRDQCDAIFIYMDRRRSGSIGKGAFECIKYYKDKKPIYLMYRRKTDDRLCFYRPIIKEFDSSRSWNDYADISYKHKLQRKTVFSEIADVVNNVQSYEQLQPETLDVCYDAYTIYRFYTTILK